MSENNTASGLNEKGTMQHGRRNLHYAKNKRASDSKNKKTKVIIFGAATVIYTAFLYSSGGAGTFLQPGEKKGKEQPEMGTLARMSANGRKLSVSTWNVAAINNNPFEYWITIEGNPDYEALMINVENFLENPGASDVPVSQVFTPKMFDTLEQKMLAVGWDENREVRKYWESDYMNRDIVSGFLKDPELGSKRLASMPDRITNTINVAGKDEPVCRPTVINMYEEDLSSLDQWFDAWMKFMFEEPLPIATSAGVESKIPYTMLKPISKAKYPAITEDEEKISIPLQTMCGAIFDAILVHMMNTVSTPDVWQPLKRTMVDNLNRKKVPHTIDILKNTYGETDVITLQEVSASFIEIAKRELGKKYHVVSPAVIDAVRDQNSVILLKKSTFPHGATGELTDLVQRSFPEGVKVPVADGDVLAITATDVDDVLYFIASFHGDTNGLATIPVLRAVKKAMASDPALNAHHFIFGLDANTYEHGQAGKKQDVLEWGKEYVSHELTSCWGDVPDASNYTTYNARTYLQPQLNKACKSSEKRKYGDVNPKDFILFGKNDFEVERTWKDNTGKKEYVEDMAFPTLDFPSDHGILSTILKPKV